MTRITHGTPGRALAAGLVLAGLLPALAAGAPTPADEAVAAAEQHVRVAATAPDAYVALAAAFMRKARETGDAGWYPRAAAALDRALALDPDDYDALRTRAWVQLGQHDFRAARATAEAAQRRRPDDWWNYGTLADACVELGDYDAATAAAERMTALHPGLPAYTRIAFLRTLTGDRPGAIEALELAVAAGSPRDPESLAWTLVHLGHEHLAEGALAAAEHAYARALDLVPDYYLALAGLGGVRAAQGRLADAVPLYERAVARVPAPDLLAALGDVHAAAGDREAAERRYATVEYMDRVAAAVGTTYGRQLALFYADHERHLADALRLARQERANRGDVYSEDALAWALLKNGRSMAAGRAIHRALRLGTEDAQLHYHAGMIAAAGDQTAVAARHLRRALALNPCFDLLQAPKARATLAALQSPTSLAREDRR